MHAVWLRLVREIKFFLESHRIYRERFSDTNKKQITEPIRKLRDEFNDTN
jgi:hypothetical protein